MVELALGGSDDLEPLEEPPTVVEGSNVKSLVQMAQTFPEGSLAQCHSATRSPCPARKSTAADLSRRRQGQENVAAGDVDHGAVLARRVELLLTHTRLTS